MILSSGKTSLRETFENMVENMVEFAQTLFRAWWRLQVNIYFADDVADGKQVN